MNATLFAKNADVMENSDSDSGSEDANIPDERKTFESCDHGRFRCRCLSQSAKTLHSVSNVMKTYQHSRVEAAIHHSHSQPGETELNLCGRHLGGMSSLPIAASLQTHPLISVIDMSYNALNEEGGINLILALITNPYVTTLTISGNNFGGTKVPAYLMVLLSQNNIIQRLDISKNKLKDKDAHLIAGGIIENNYVTYMDMSSNLIEERGAGYLGRALAINNTLETVNLSHNCVRGTGAVQLGKSVMFNSELTELNLRGNGLGYHGALAIRECLSKNVYLKKIDISSNRINWEGAIVLAHGLEMNTTLETLVVGDNPLTTTGCMDLIDAINSTSSLKMLDITHVNVVTEFRQVVRIIQEKNTEFKAIHGQVIHSHDVLGLRKKRELHPMYKILKYLLDKELRPVELLRSMDKTVSFKLTSDEFLQRCHQLGISIKPYEEPQLMEYILSDISEREENIITYTVMLNSIERFIEQERMYRLKQRKRAQAVTRYQGYLLDRTLPQVLVNGEVNSLTNGLLDKLVDSNDKHEIVSRRIANAVKSTNLRRNRTAF